MNMEKNEIYNKNMKCILESNPYLWETLQEQEESEYDVFVDTSISGEKIVGINLNGKDWYFNSRYSAEERAKQKEEKRDNRHERVSVKEKLAEKKDAVIKMNAGKEHSVPEKKKEAVI